MMSNTLNTDTLTQAEQDRVDRRKRVIELHRKGYSVQAMAEVLGVTTQRIYQQLKQLGLPNPTERDAS